VPPARVGFWLLSLLALFVTARALLGYLPPFGFALAGLVGYVSFCTLGVLLPKLEMYGDVVWRVPGARAVALTFDDGPHPETTRKVLALLAQRKKKATFFVVGHKVLKYPDVVREIVAAGHELGLHGFTHDRLYAFKAPIAVELDVRRTQDAIEWVSGLRPTAFRPPIGHVSHRTVAGAKRAGVVIVAFSTRSFDGLRSADPARVASRLVKGLRPGAILLMHDAAEREDFEPAGLRALPEVLEVAEERGLAVVTLAELLEQSEFLLRVQDSAW
jgi:peptidoglycan/xylan/chitin deacetylase (PgdA/CDA1 family)